MSVKSTRLRYIRAKSSEDISRTISRLPFKVEIKGAPAWDGKRWTVWFIIPEDERIDFNNLEL